MVKVAGEESHRGSREDCQSEARKGDDDKRSQHGGGSREDEVEGQQANKPANGKAMEQKKIDELQTVIFELKNGKTRSGIPILDPQLLAISSVVGRLLVLQLKSLRLDARGSVFQDGKFDEAVKEKIGSSNESLSAIGVIGALILSITAPFLFNPIQQSDIITGDAAYKIFLHESDSERLQYAVSSLLMLSALCSGLSVVSSLSIYVHLNSVLPDVNSKLWFLRHAWMVLPEKLLVAALFCLCPAAPLGMMLCYGDTMGLIAVILYGFLLIVYLSWQLYMQISCRRYVAPRFVEIGNFLQQELDDFQRCRQD
eukprot:768161-Hanusia_phi.AAC.1